MATTTKTNAAIPFSPRLANRVRRLRPRMMFINEREPQQGSPPDGQIVPVRAVADGFMFPRPQDTELDVTIRMPTIGALSTVTQDVYTQADRLKGGWISHVGYEFNNPHGFFQCRTTLLINGGPPANYQFRTVDTSGAVDGSFPTAQIGTIADPTRVRILLPSNGLIQLQAVNASVDEVFSLVFRFKGWSFGN